MSEVGPTTSASKCVGHSKTGAPCDESTGHIDQTYLDIWAPEIKAKGWGEKLSERPYTSRPISILDVTPSGSITDWEIKKPSRGRHKLNGKEWACSVRKMLRARNQNTVTRLIVFEESARFEAQETVGVHYGIEPDFFRDIAHSEAVAVNPGAWNLMYDQRLPGFMTGFPSRHLDFGYGWTSLIIRRAQDGTPEPRNIGGLMPSILLISWLTSL